VNVPEGGDGGDWLKTPAGKAYLEREYALKLRSTHEIAADLGTYPNRVVRALRYHGLHVRNHSEARKAGLTTGRIDPPMLGRAHREDSREKIRIGRIAIVQSEDTKSGQDEADHEDSGLGGLGDGQ
jgi:hypothetical protein